MARLSSSVRKHLQVRWHNLQQPPMAKDAVGSKQQTFRDNLLRVNSVSFPYATVFVCSFAKASA